MSVKRSLMDFWWNSGLYVWFIRFFDTFAIFNSDVYETINLAHFWYWNKLNLFILYDKSWILRIMLMRVFIFKSISTVFPYIYLST